MLSGWPSEAATFGIRNLAQVTGRPAIIEDNPSMDRRAPLGGGPRRLRLLRSPEEGMGGSFACPECGTELAPEGLTPGREVQCAECSTWVEVPYLPRVAPPKRAQGRRKRPAWEWKLLRFAIAFAVVAVLGLVASQMIGSKVRNDRERVFAELVASADKEGISPREFADRNTEKFLALYRKLGISKDIPRLETGSEKASTEPDSGRAEFRLQMRQQTRDLKIAITVLFITVSVVSRAMLS